MTEQDKEKSAPFMVEYGFDRLMVEAEGFLPARCVGCGDPFEHHSLDTPSQAAAYGLSSDWLYLEDAPDGAGNYCPECQHRYGWA